MAHQFYALRIKEIIRETPDCISIDFDLPEDLQEKFQFKAGQNITIKQEINGEEIRRSYSICAAPFEQKLKIAIKKINGGLFSTFANDVLKSGEVLNVMPPTGNFTTKHNEDQPQYLGIAAGSGITPIMSIIKDTLTTQPNSTFTLIYGNKNRSSIAFFEELESLKNKYIERFTLINILSREKMDAEIFYGRIDADKLNGLQKLINYKAFSAAYLCGPEAMIFAGSDFLQTAGMQKNQIHFELFGTPFLQTKSNSNGIIDAENVGPKSAVSIKLDGRTFDFQLAYNGQNILDAALQQGADLPFACKGGVCCTCRAKLMSGNVRMDVNYALEQEEVEQGFILTCQAHPTTEKVFIDFDVK
ncbi:MAG: phenylacetate-CoA oxygenase/reductase subunit PaaK [Sphingobacteriales bacterium]|nr:phenylacetate-CoA oxygenase/reductase subunit PaaK [Sphingobacteriales bacterium]